MNIFHLYAEKETGGMRDARMWLVIAANLFDAVSLVPEGFYVKAAEVQFAAVAGPGRDPYSPASHASHLRAQIP